ncbi:unnamed protein product, partial [marine sediment metagenome]
NLLILGIFAGVYKFLYMVHVQVKYKMVSSIDNKIMKYLIIESI